MATPNPTRFPPIWLIILVGLLGGCSAVGSRACYDRLADELWSRTGHSLGPGGHPDEASLPPGISWEDGVSEDDAVTLALWNNAAFQETLTDLGLARADLIQAGLLPNPEVAYFFHVTDKPFKYVIDLPLDALWLRPIRLAAAGRESARVCDRLTQVALDLIRDARQAHTDGLLAKGRLRVAEEAVRLRSRISELAEVRLKAGDISAQEAATARIDALLARQEAVRVEYAVAVAEERLRTLLSLGATRAPLRLVEPQAPPPLDQDAEALTAEAVATRPDALAAEENAAAAAERLRLARVGWVRFLGI